jgi:hypothetical protein
LVIGLAISVIGYIIMPKPKAEKSQDVTDLDNPTAEAGRPIPVVFGELWVTSPNCLWFGEKETTSRKVDA